jgi:hypothetical protein
MAKDTAPVVQTPVSKRSHQNWGAVIAIVAIIVIAAVASLYVEGALTGGRSPIAPPKPFDFSLSLLTAEAAYVQGDNATVPFSVELVSRSPGQVTLNASGGPSGTVFVFEQQVGAPNFTSVLFASIPQSAPSDIYNLTVTATGGGKTHTGNYTLYVLNAKIIVSGNVTTTIPGIQLGAVIFMSERDGQTYMASLAGSAYSITLPNQQGYFVETSWTDSQGRTGTLLAGNLVVNTGIGANTMTQDFVVPSATG